MLGNKPQSLPFDILSSFRIKPFQQYNFCWEDIFILSAPQMGLLVNSVSDGNKRDIYSPSEMCMQKKGEGNRI